MRPIRAVWLAAAMPWLFACGSSSISTTAPTGSKCQVTVSTSMHSAPSAGVSGTADVSTTRDCTWAATSTAAWVSIASGANGQGDGTIGFRVGANSDPTPRHATLSVNDASLDIAQDAAPCDFTVAPAGSDVVAAGGSVRITVTASSAACAWTSVSNASWIAVQEGASARGSGTATLNVAANTSGARDGTVTSAGKTVVLHQGAATCSFSIAPVDASIPYAGGSGTVAVSMLTGAACPWTAASDQPWLSVVSGASGAGSGTVVFGVSPNAAAARSGTIAIAGKTFTVSQAAAPCTYALAPSSATIPAAGGAGSFSVGAHASCPWTAVSSADWIAVTAGASGDGTGSVGFSAAPNGTASPRTGTIVVANQTFTLTQPAPCVYSVTPPAQAVPTTGGSGAFALSTGPACSWTAASNAPWITLTSPSAGSGPTSVAFAAAANPTTLPRTGTVTIEGQTVTVTQDGAPCVYTIAPTSQTVGTGGGGGTVTITASDQSCRWTAATNNPDWLTITSAAAGTGNGSISFVAAANPTPGVQRTGSLTIAAQPFTVSQP